METQRSKLRIAQLFIGGIHAQMYGLYVSEFCSGARTRKLSMTDPTFQCLYVAPVHGVHFVRTFDRRTHRRAGGRLAEIIPEQRAGIATRSSVHIAPIAFVDDALCACAPPEGRGQKRETAHCVGANGMIS